MAFSDKVKQYGSVEAARKALGYTEQGNAWVKTGGANTASQPASGPSRVIPTVKTGGAKTEATPTVSYSGVLSSMANTASQPASGPSKVVPAIKTGGAKTEATPTVSYSGVLSSMTNTAREPAAGPSKVVPAIKTGGAKTEATPTVSYSGVLSSMMDTAREPAAGPSNGTRYVSDSETASERAMAAGSSAGYYDPDKDYSAAIETAKRTGASDEEIDRLEKERQNKIDDKYGGKEPTMIGSNKTYKQATDDGDQRSIDESIISTPGGSLYYGDGTKAVTHAPEGYNTNLDPYLGDVDTMIGKLAEDGYINADGTLKDWEAVNELMEQKALKAQYEGTEYDPMDDFSAIVQIFGSPSGSGGGSGSKTQYRKESGGGGGSGGSTGRGATGGVDALIKELIDLYSGSGVYAQALKEQQAANQAGVEKAVNALEGQKATTDQSYANLFKQLYLNKMAEKKNVGQQMAAQGVTGGAAESTLLGMDTQYQEALRQGEESRIAATDELDRAITDARLTGDITDAELAAANAKERTNSYAAILQNLINRYDNQEASRLSREDLLAEIAREEAASAKTYAYQTAMQLLQSGSMASDDLLNAAGISRADAEALVAAVVASRAKPTTSYGGGGNSKPTATQYEVAINAAAAGDRSAEVRDIVERYTGLPLETALLAYGDVVEPEEDKPTREVTSTANNLLRWYKTTGGLTETRLDDLYSAYMSGEITETEYNYILDQLGY